MNSLGYCNENNAVAVHIPWEDIMLIIKDEQTLRAVSKTRTEIEKSWTFDFLDQIDFDDEALCWVYNIYFDRDSGAWRGPLQKEITRILQRFENIINN